MKINRYFIEKKNGTYQFTLCNVTYVYRFIILLIILCCVALCVYHWISRKQNKDEPPICPGCLPFIGHAYLLLGDSVKTWEVIKNYSIKTIEVGGVATAWLGPKKVYLVSDPEDYATVARKCLEKNIFYEFATPWLGQGLLTEPLEKWKIHRRLINPAFNQTVLDGFIDIFNSLGRRFVKNLEEKIGTGPFDSFPYIRRNTLETICLAALGIDLSDETVQNNEFMLAVDKILSIFTDRIQKIWLYPDFIFNLSSKKKRQDKYAKILHDFSNTVLKKRKEDYLKNRNMLSDKETKGPKFKPFMDLLLELSVEKKLFNDTEIRDHVDTIIAAGYETSADAFMYAILLIGSFPVVQEKIVEELKDIFGDDNRDVTKQDLSKLKYLEAVIKESMRYFTVVPVTARTLDRDVKLRNCTLSKGYTCIIFGHGIHRHPIWGPDADEFIPERWLDPARLPKIPSAYAAFNIGTRMCIGRSYAYMSMKITLAHLIRNYKITGDNTKLINKFDIILKPVSGYHIAIERRK